jgi:hypothetical protein
MNVSQELDDKKLGTNVLHKTHVWVEHARQTTLSATDPSHTHTHTPDRSSFCYNLLWAGFPCAKWEELWRTLVVVIIHVAQLSSINLIAENPKYMYVYVSVSAKDWMTKARGMNVLKHHLIQPANLWHHICH